MLHTRRNIAVAMAATLFMAVTAYAGDSADEVAQRIGTGDPVVGKAKSAKCQACHGKDGNSTAPDTPKIAGQYASYIEKQIRDYQSSTQIGVHSDPKKSGIASGEAGHQDLLDIAAYFASQKQMRGPSQKELKAPPRDNKIGKQLFLEGNADKNVYACINCHGDNGKGNSPENAMFPVIGGQNKYYLIKQITAFGTGKRSNDPASMMCDVAKQLSQAEIEAVADYISGL